MPSRVNSLEQIAFPLALEMESFKSPERFTETILTLQRFNFPYDNLNKTLDKQPITLNNDYGLLDESLLGAKGDQELSPWLSKKQAEASEQGAFYVYNFNKASREVQQDAGVDPDECITVVEAATDMRTPLITYLASLAKKRYPIPSSGIWREHDVDLHLETIRETHPDLADFVAQAAQYGFDTMVSDNANLVDSDNSQAVAIGNKLDLILANVDPDAPTLAFSLLELMGLMGDTFGTDLTANFNIAHTIAATQVEHRGKIVAKRFSQAISRASRMIIENQKINNVA